MVNIKNKGGTYYRKDVNRMTLTKKRRIFCDEYLKDTNGTRAYKVAYPSVKNDNTAATNATRLLRNADVKKYIDDRLDEMSSIRIADATEIMEFLTSVMRGEISEPTLTSVGDGTQEIIEIGTGNKDRIKAAELIGKHYKMFTDKKEVKQENLNLDIIIGGWDEEEPENGN